MRVADHCGFGHCVVRAERGLDLGGPHTVTRYINHIINAARNPVKPILIALAAIARKIVTGIGGKISVNKALMIAINRSHLTRP